MNKDRDLQQPGNSQTNSDGGHTVIFGQKIMTSRRMTFDNYNYITQHKRLNGIKCINLKATATCKTALQKEQRRHFNSYKQRTSYRNVDPKSTAENEAEFQEVSVRVYILRKNGKKNKWKKIDWY